MRHIYQNVVQDGRGNFVSGASVTVYLAGTTTKATIYTTATGGTADADSVITSGTDGTFTFYIDEKDYHNVQRFKVLIEKSGFTSETWDYLQVLPARGYYVDASETNQGAAGSGNSLKDLIDAIGTSKKATIVLPHSGSGNTTTYTLSTTEVVPSNITLKFENGAIIADDASNASLTISGPIEAGPYQIFDWGNGTGYIELADGTYVDPLVTEVNVKWFGATGDNSTDDTDAFFYAIHAANAGGDAAGTYALVDKPTLFIPPGEYRITAGGLTEEINCPVFGPQASIFGYDDTDDTILLVDYSRTWATFELRAIMGYDEGNGGAYDDSPDHQATGLRIIGAYHSIFKIRRLLGLVKGIHIDGATGDRHVGSSKFHIGNFRSNQYGIYYDGGATANLENHHWEVEYFYNQSINDIYLTTAGGNVQTNEFEIGALECNVPIDTGGIYIENDTCRRNTFRIRSIIDATGTGKTIETSTAGKNVFVFPAFDFDNITTDTQQIFDNHLGNSNQLSNVAGRSLMRASSAPTVGGTYFIPGDIVLNSDPDTDGIIGWVNILAGTPGQWRQFGRITGSVALTTSSDDFDATGRNIIYAEATAGHIVLGGLQGGVSAQELMIVKTTLANNLTIEHSEGVGTQDILTPDAADIVFTGTRGGVTLLCNGTSWFVVSE